ncbi:MAG: YgiQ family radical SAM protein [Sedimentisphaerales bacterium]|nr:YgiQ family radical SAM protein [Sedimentisphaerales bacterium]MBN2841525.1 YgiQ family radical SAM protein [Sedimentisphaerales bacterium]
MNIKTTVKKLVSPLPMTLAEMRSRGWEQADIILITGDAYIDHPSFGVALIGRWLEKHGYKVAVISQPDWRSVADFQKLGAPRLFWGITGGSVDSRLNNYSSMGHRRGQDSFSPGGVEGLRPDKPLAAYGTRVREAYKDVPVIIGGLEASLRRLVHYDYIEDKIKRSILIDAKADLLVFGMGEMQILEIANRLSTGSTVEQLTDIPGTAWPVTRGRAVPADAVEIPGAMEQDKDRDQVIVAHKLYHEQANPYGKPVVQEQNPGKVVVNPPALPLTSQQMDEVYNMDFTRRWHPLYDKAGGVPALEPIQFSITSHRGCFGGCNFCSLYYHQGKVISSRSIDSILAEADKLLAHPDFKGTISDIGGPSANMYGMKCGCDKPCQRSSCLFPSICKNLIADDSAAVELLEKVVKWQEDQKRKVNVFIASGVRHDLLLHSTKQSKRKSRYAELIIGHFTGGHLKLAPEHIDPEVLRLMGKPSFSLFEEFEEVFERLSLKAGKKQYIVPYFISAHPGSTTDHAQRLYKYLEARNWKLRQVQDFTPVPLTQATAVFVSGKDEQGRKVYIARGRQEKKTQMAYLKYHEQGNRELIKGKGKPKPRRR